MVQDVSNNTIKTFPIILFQNVVLILYMLGKTQQDNKALTLKHKHSLENKTHHACNYCKICNEINGKVSSFYNLGGKKLSSSLARSNIQIVDCYRRMDVADT